MRDFRTLLNSPGLSRVLFTQLAARFPAGMYSLGFLMHAERTLGSYTAAGLVLAAFSIGMAIAGPFMSRQLSRFGTVPVLLTTIVASAAAVVLIALLPLNLPGAMGLAALAGAAMPPVIPAVRTLYPMLAPRQLITALFSFDAALQEIIWVIGPVAITLMVASMGSSNALLVVAAVQVIGGLLFVLSPSVRGLKIPPSTRRFGRVLRNGSVLLMIAASLLLLAAFAAIETSVVATFGDGSIDAGIVLAIVSVGSLFGGLYAGNRPLTRWSLPARMALIAFGYGLATLGSGFWWHAFALFIAGIGIAPALAAVSSIVAGSVKFSDTAEAYGWIGTGQLLGASIGSAVAGVAIDASGGHGGLLVSFGIAVLAVLVCVLFRNAQPDLRLGIITDGLDD